MKRRGSYRQNTLFILATEVSFGLGVVLVPDHISAQLEKSDVQALVVLTPHPDKENVFNIYIGRTAELDFNGHSHYIRFSRSDTATATFPGTGMFDGDLLHEVIECGAKITVLEHNTEMSVVSRSLRIGIRFGDRLKERVRDYTTHLDIKEMTIRQIEEELALHRAALRKDYWIWEDDDAANKLGSLNCPILIEPHQLARLISMSDDQRKEILNDE